MAENRFRNVDRWRPIRVGGRPRQRGTTLLTSCRWERAKWLILYSEFHGDVGKFVPRATAIKSKRLSAINLRKAAICRPIGSGSSTAGGGRKDTRHPSTGDRRIPKTFRLLHFVKRKSFVRISIPITCTDRYEKKAGHIIRWRSVRTNFRCTRTESQRKKTNILKLSQNFTIFCPNRVHVFRTTHNARVSAFV